MNASVYILYSHHAKQFYVGVTTNPVEERILKHNQQFYGAGFTVKASDWEVVFELSCESFEQAVRIERHIKGMKSKKYIANLIAYPELRAKLAARFARDPLNE